MSTHLSARHSQCPITCGVLGADPLPAIAVRTLAQLFAYLRPEAIQEGSAIHHTHVFFPPNQSLLLTRLE